MAGTSWDSLAAWYDGWVGERGSRYHRDVVVPAVLELLDVRPREWVLDVDAARRRGG